MLRGIRMIQIVNIFRNHIAFKKKWDIIKRNKTLVSRNIIKRDLFCYTFFAIPP